MKLHRGEEYVNRHVAILNQAKFIAYGFSMILLSFIFVLL